MTTEMNGVVYCSPVRAIVMFGPASAAMGTKAGDFYQVTIDPNMTSAQRKFIRFGCYKGDEIIGWQRVDAMTVLETLGPNDEGPHIRDGYRVEEGASVTMRTLG